MCIRDSTPSYATNNSVFDVTAVSTTQEATMKSLVVVAPYEVRFADVTNDPDQLSSAGTVRYSYNGKAAPCRYTSQYLKALYSGDTRLQGLTTSTYRAGLMAAQEEALRVADSGDSATTYDRLRQHFAPVSYTHLRAHETPEHLVCRLLLEKKKKKCT
eukprot:TRINITY_DN45671_c0_g1_i1.p1 TRINITY_DN45671_c0_g1~~TRINITY_DN45671_c0_g1_i1.p1  ORF type:complete len:158 (+),score=32.86 TRINITY_DN45671_c0_g1_i1:77-550(+)